LLIINIATINKHTVTIYMCDYRRGYEMVNGFIDYLCTRIVTTSNYSATANLHNSRITTAPIKVFPGYCVFTSRCLVTAASSGDSSASLTQILLSQPSVRNSCQLSTQLQRHLFSPSLAELN
jgi:hypothetical protein